MTLVPRELIQNEYSGCCFGFNLIFSFSLKLASFNDIESLLMFPEQFLHKFSKFFLLKLLIIF